ncbi:tetratricopeptide repeat protein [Gloeothece verrucosa]|uniref:TPR repeat-containing protein n=1 Tax=Gloeothece verrucosa (strain PCC 7822) TaxID=497965 RepID=E0UA78_GLOV7|nr:tetratricopeptide repeat protein [Gloeothece verrucosa]ADN17383.1 TPR repeat-containing protein [Gloeothece verrucosa PCC 7822]
MNLNWVSLITGFGIIFIPVASGTTASLFSSHLPSGSGSSTQLISQAASTEDRLEDRLVEGMDKGMLGDYQGAIEDFTEVIRLYPNSAEAYYNRGIAYSKLGNSGAAMADYNKAVELNPNLAEAYVDRAQIYSGLGKTSDALKDLKRAADLFKQQGNTIAYNQTLKMIQKLQ